MTTSCRPALRERPVSLADRQGAQLSRSRRTLEPGAASPHDLPLWPTRVQLQRTAGWRKPPTAVSVARPHRYGNPHRVTDGLDAAAAVALYVEDLVAGRLPYGVDEVRADLAGRDLMCWCPLDRVCHADVLLDIANGVLPIQALVSTSR